MEQGTVRPSGSRVLIIGLDGATFRVMQPLLNAGKLPTIGRLIAQGVSGVLTSIIPPHTGPAWPSLFTGKNPGKHGIFLFEHGDVRNYLCYSGLVTSDMVAGQTLFDLAGKRGLRVAAIRVPMTYPAWQINGVMVSGYPATGLTSRYVYPPELEKEIPPISRARFGLRGNPPQEYQQHLEEEIDATTRLSCKLLGQERWDLCMLVYQQPDHAHHWLWRYMDPESPLYTPEDAAKYGHFINACYERIDAGIAQILEHVDENTVIFIVSDHGADRTPNHCFYTNRWLRSLGLLAGRRARPGIGRRLYNLRRLVPAGWRSEAVRFIRVRLPVRLGDRVRRYMMNADQYDWSRTRAYRFPIYHLEAIAINLKGRQPEGIVEPGDEYERLRDEIIQELRKLRVPGTDEPLVREIYKREEIFSGPYTERAPDIIFSLAPDYDGSREIGLDGDFFGPMPPSALINHNGWHDRDGIFIAAGPSVQVGMKLDHAHLLDVAPTVLYTLGLPIPTDMDGRVLTEVFTIQHEQQWEEAAPITAAVGTSTVLSSAEEADIKERLRNLGYL
jgi:predicted AlkP superfamily phosphohydrolase/phosphomutase